MISKIENFRKYFFILFSISILFIFFFYNFKFSLTNQSYILFFLVSAIGIPHGFFDFSIGKKIFKKYQSMWLFYFVLSYVSISTIYFAAWFIFPSISLIFFLLIASYHFGFEEFNYMKNSKTSYLNANIFFKGTIIVFTPILFHNDQVNYLFSILIGYDFPSTQISFLQKLIWSFLSISQFLFFDREENIFHKIESIAYFTNFVLLPPLISFTIYFCFSHSIKHFLESIFVNKYIPMNFTVKGFLFLIIVLSMIFSIFSIFFISNHYNISINETIIKFIFIVLACLTLPHMIFNMWPYREK